MPGRLYDQKRPAGLQHAIGHCLELFEVAAAAPHGATLGYDEIDDRIAPILSDQGADISAEQKLLQSGILDYAFHFARFHSNGVVEFEGLRLETVRRLAKLLLRPTLAQAGALKTLSHSLDWGTNKRRPLVSPDINPLLTLAPLRFYDALKESYWLEGCMRVSRIPGALVCLSLVRRALRARDVIARIRRASNHYFRPSLG